MKCSNCEYYEKEEGYCTAFECNGLECPTLPCEMRKPNFYYVKRWRESHREEFKVGKREYYRKTQKALNSYQRWTEEDLEMVLAHEYTDHELSRRLGRSVGAIQRQRNKMKGEGYETR